MRREVVVMVEKVGELALMPLTDYGGLVLGEHRFNDSGGRNHIFAILLNEVIPGICFRNIVQWSLWSARLIEDATPAKQCHRLGYTLRIYLRAQDELL
jgi:hypothetical protein